MNLPMYNFIILIIAFIRRWIPYGLHVMEKHQQTEKALVNWNCFQKTWTDFQDITIRSQMNRTTLVQLLPYISKIQKVSTKNRIYNILSIIIKNYFWKRLMVVKYFNIIVSTINTICVHHFRFWNEIKYALILRRWANSSLVLLFLYSRIKISKIDFYNVVLWVFEVKIWQ